MRRGLGRNPPESLMAKSEHSPIIYVIGADGDVITRDSLPPTSTQHWRIRLNAKVVAAVDCGLMTRDEVCARSYV
jgi:hypothetical protein